LIIYAFFFFGLGFVGILTSHFIGLNAESIYWCIIIICAFVICIIRQRKRNQQIKHKHHEENPVDHDHHKDK
jgi:hypothetical protein